jgi:hypothetical protein
MSVMQRIVEAFRGQDVYRLTNLKFMAVHVILSAD